VEDAVDVIEEPWEIVSGEVELDEGEALAERTLEVGLLRVAPVVVSKGVHADNVVSAGEQRLGQV
jgi:hypothetical protein